MKAPLSISAANDQGGPRSAILCIAIQSRRLVSFAYEGRVRIVAPYCHGFTRRGEVLRAIQVSGEMPSGKQGFGKLWMLAKMFDLRVLEAPYEPDDPDYNPNDSAMVRIHCRA